ncbi:MAG: hypoxanthine phosphoribosyltransferase [Limnochordaceae bacterium]|nr:hypoxanthine phosphoribosyltransferase [Limnochordaceae bacterium]
MRPPGPILITQEQLAVRNQELGAQISADYAGTTPVLISVLRGAIYFLTDLTREISIPIHLDFLAISRYEEVSDTTGIVRITKDLDVSITDRDVLIVEDIIDTGLTLSYLIRHLERRRPRSLQVCTLLDNRTRRLVDLPVRYTGFAIPDVFVVGYGLDWHEEYRHLPYLAILEEGQKPTGKPAAGNKPRMTN